MLTTPGGRSACRQMSANHSADSGVVSAGFSTTVLPQASAGAAGTARWTASGAARPTSARVSSVAGLIVVNVSLAGVNSPPMNSPYDSWSSTMLDDSGAGAYSKRPISVHRHVVGTGVDPGR